MKNLIPVVIALVAGLVVGAWQPRGELLETRAEMDRLREESKKNDCRGARAMSGIRDILRAQPPTVGNDADPPEAPGAVADNAPREVDGPAQAAPAISPEDIAGEVATMRTALDARRAQALAALSEQAELDADQEAELSAAMDTMNRELQAEVEQMVARLNEGESPDRRDIMEFAANTLDIVLVADDAIRGIVPTDTYANVDDEAVDPFSYLSGDAVASLSKLEALPEWE